MNRPKITVPFPAHQTGRARFEHHDLVVGFQSRTDAERFLAQFRERLTKFGLELHPDKTRLIEFGRFAARDRKARGEGKPETFTFLGFTHYCGQRHKSGTFTVWRITAKKRMVAKLKVIKAELQRRMHNRMAEVGAWLRKVVLGYYQYHAVPGNTNQLRIFKLRVCRLWQSVLVRRSQRAKMRWERFTPVLNRWISSTPCSASLSRCTSSFPSLAIHRERQQHIPWHSSPYYVSRIHQKHSAAYGRTRSIQRAPFCLNGVDGFVWTNRVKVPQNRA